MSDPTTRAELLKKVPLLANLDPDSFSRLLEAVREETHPPETNIVEIGEPGHTLYIILEGTVQVLSPARSMDFELARLGPDDFFGEMALLNAEPRSATVRTMAPTRVMALGKKEFQKILLSSPSVALELLRTLSLRIRDADEHISGLSDKAMRDPLTGLLNRRGFHERLHEEVDRHRRYGDLFSLFLLDLDHFKAVNDNFGHTVGDEILAWIGRLLDEHTRATDIPFRVGGEEFAILAPATEPEIAESLGERIVSLISEADPPVDFELHITLSVGYACCPDDSSRASDLYDLADQALFEAKDRGRNQVCGTATEKVFRESPSPADPSRSK